MNIERWQQIEEVFDAAIEMAPEDRAVYLDRACGDDTELRTEVEKLLTSDAEGGQFLEEAIGGSLLIWEEGQVEPKLDRHIGPYRLIERLGFGGMGEVYLAERDDHEYQQRVAIKLIRPGLDNERILERFRRERQILARLEHPNIARLLDGGTSAEGLPYFVMEHIDGQPIDVYCRERRLGLEARLELFQDVCSAVRYAHQHLIIHRDLKPSNILVTEDGTVKLLDFGIAKLLSPDDSQLDLTFTAEQPLTLNYASPEQLRGEPVQTRSDVYSLGVVLYELLTGRLPFQLRGLPRRDVERIVCETEAEWPSRALASTVETPRPPRSDGWPRRLRGDLDTIILTAMHKDPARRYSSPEALASDIGRHLGGRPVLAHRDTLAYRTSKFVRRNWLALSVTAAFLLLLSVSLVSRLQQARRITAEHRQNTLTLEFLEDLFNFSDPSEGRGEDVTALELLDRGGDRLETELAEEPLARARLHDTIGHVYQTIGHFEDARRHLRTALDLRRDRLPANHPEVGRSLNRWASLKRETGQVDEAVVLHRDAIAILRQNPEAQAQNWLAESYNDLGMALRSQGQSETAAEYFDDAWQLYNRITEADRGSQLTALNNLALVQLDLQRYPEAEELFRRLTQEAAKVHGDEPHPETAQYLNNLAAVLQNQGRYEEAKALYLEAFDMRQRLYAKQPHHPNLIASLNNLGTVEFYLGDFDAAEDAFRDAIDRAAEPDGPESGGIDEYGMSLHNLAEVVKVKGDHEKALAYYRDALAFRDKWLGEEHIESLRTLANMAALQITMGDYLEAERSYEALLGVFERIGTPSAERALSLGNLALSKRYRGEYEEAADLYAQARDLFVDAFGEEHPEVARMTAGLATVHAYRGQNTEADELFRQALDKQRRLLGENHPRVASTLTGLGSVLIQLDRLQDAQADLEHALEIHQRTLSPDHWQVAEVRSLLGFCLYRLGQSENAESMLRDGYLRIVEQRGITHPMAREARGRLARFYREREEGDKLRSLPSP